MNELTIFLRKQPVVYITRDVERAFVKTLKRGYFIISNSTPFAKRLAKNNNNIILIHSDKMLSTSDLLLHKKTYSFISSLVNPKILVFKNTPLIERMCKEKKYTLLNPPAELASQIEEKISQLSWLGELCKFLPEHKILLGEELKWEGNKFIVQFNRAHTGSGTVLIKNENDLENIKLKFPKRPIRVSKYIDGLSLTSNNIVWGKKIFNGPVNYQITGIPPFTDLSFATVGNDWSLVNKILKNKQKREIKNISISIGKKLLASGWKGLFGLDFILEKNTGNVYLIEINARQPAGATYESELQKTNSQEVKTLEGHLAALLEIKPSKHKISDVTNGAQIVKRITKNNCEKISRKTLKSLQKLRLNIIEYPNSELGADQLRIQYKKGIMMAHNELNEMGKIIANLM